MSLISWKFQYCQKKYELEKIEKDFRRQLYEFEMSTLKSQEKIRHFQYDHIQATIHRLTDYRKSLFGFNLWACCGGAVLYHYLYLTLNRKLLYEMEKKAIPHIAFCMGFGIASGYIFGNICAYDMGLYRLHSKILKDLKSMKNDFEKYYIQKKEQEFDE